MEINFESVVIEGQRYLRVPPNPTRMVMGMSRLSYEFDQAIADLVDNSIAAGASKVDIQIEQRLGGNVYVHVADNGIGITEDELPRAIQYGAPDRNDASSLGVYGFGLKTACQSFTSKFSVVSRATGHTTVNMLTFDESVIRTHDDFLFPISEASAKFASTLEEVAAQGSGTLIVIENADRILTSADSGNPRKMQAFLSAPNKGKIPRTMRHLRKTFQRFLDADDTRVPTVKISLNGEDLLPWDPFCSMEGNFLEHEWLSPELKTKSGKSGHVVMRGYILPTQVEFNDKELYKDAEVSPSTHGVYVYRENRLIEQATYFNLFKKDTHMANLRVEFSYEGGLDELFQTALQKGSMNLGDLEDAVRDFLTPLIRETNQRSRGNARKKDTSDIHGLSQKRISSAENRVSHADITAIDSNLAEVTSKYGKVILPIPSQISPDEPLPINPVESINDGNLWQMRLQNGKQVVELNKGHDFYSKVYLPNRTNTLAIQGLDIILWSLAITEANCTIPEYKKQFREFRFEVSRTLRELVETLPESSYDELDG
jgi:hypothetical protein